MYEELVKCLRRCDADHFCEDAPRCPMIKNREDYRCIWIMHKEAADAIDALVKYKMNTPPIQIGTKVYFADVWEVGIESGTVSMIQQKADKSWKFRISNNSSVFDRPVSEIGKTVFLTYEEAENYLKDKGEHKHDKDML